MLHAKEAELHPGDNVPWRTCLDTEHIYVHTQRDPLMADMVIGGNMQKTCRTKRNINEISENRREISLVSTLIVKDEPSIISAGELRTFCGSQTLELKKKSQSSFQALSLLFLMGTSFLRK